MMLPTFSALGAGPTILMLHGIAGGHLAFAPQVELFAGNGYRAVAWDMPGYGHSAPIEAYNFKGLAQSCIALAELLVRDDERQSLILIGHGMGGMVAQEVVARRPDLVSRLVLAGTPAATGPVDAAWRKPFMAQCAALLDEGRTMVELADTMVPRMAGPGALPEGLKLAAHCLALVPPSTFRRALDALEGFDRSGNLQNIHVPTLLIAGETDKSAPPALMQAMGAAIAGSTFIEMRGIGQLQNLEAPEEFDGAVLNFLATPRLQQ